MRKIKIAPTNVTATTNGLKVILKWGAVKMADTYKVYRDNTLITPTPITTTSYTDNGPLVVGQSYSYQISAVNALGEGPKSVAVNVVALGLPVAPTNVTATPGDRKVTLGWQ